MNQKIAPLLLLLLLTLFTPLVKGKDTGDEVVGYYNGHCANSHAWRQFDLLMQVEKVADTGTQELYSEISLIRYIVDFDSSHLLIAAKSKYVVGASALAQSTEAVRLCGMVTNGVASRKFVFPGQVHSFSGSFQAGLSSLNIPDPRCVGLAKFPTEFYADPAGFGFERIVASGQLLIPSSTSLPSNRTIRFETVRPFETTTQNAQSITNYEYQLDTLMPKRHSVQFSIETSSGSKTFPQFAEVYEWTEIDNIFVPKSILQDSVGFYEIPKGSPGIEGVKDGERFNLATTVTFHWFSLNEPFEPGRFSIDALNDVTELTKLLDPKLNIADSILTP